MVTTDEHHVDELLESLGPKEWVLAEMAATAEDFAALRRYRDELLKEHAGELAVVYRGELLCMVDGPEEIYEEIARRKLAPWQVAMAVIDEVPRGAIPGRYFA
jgi:hypothetical protein